MGLQDTRPVTDVSLNARDDVDGIMAFIDHWDKARHDLEMDIDGVVIKVDDLDPGGVGHDREKSTLGHRLQVPSGTGHHHA